MSLQVRVPAEFLATCSTRYNLFLYYEQFTTISNKVRIQRRRRTSRRTRRTESWPVKPTLLLVNRLAGIDILTRISEYYSMTVVV
jgi:hypothetical protein